MEERLVALEARVQRLEDERDIARLIASYGPLVDDGAAEDVADLWTDTGVYDVDGLYMEGRDAITAMVNSKAHQKFIEGGCAHFQGPVHTTIDGDTATVAGYSVLILHGESGFTVRRATANHWVLERTSAGWRVRRRTSRALDGTAAAHALLRRGVGGVADS